MWRCLTLVCIIVAANNAVGQEVQDSSTIPDTVIAPIVKRHVVPSKPKVRSATFKVHKDSTFSNTKRDTIRVALNNSWLRDSFLFTNHPFYRFTNPSRYTTNNRQWQGKEVIFYSLLGLLIFFALIKNSFYKYIQDLIKIFLRTTVRQRQIKDQLVQSPLPSLLLNIFFLVSLGMFLTLLLQHFRLGLQFSVWSLFLYCVLGLIVIYGVKYLALKLVGWALQLSEAFDAYIFIVFTTNKIMGISLLPFLIILAFTYGSVSQIAITLGSFTIAGMFAYRYFLSYVSIHRQVSISFFHFFLYLCAFEIAPLLLINKLLFRFLS